MKRYNVKNISNDTVTVYDSEGKSYTLNRHMMCNVDIKPESSRLLVEEIENGKKDTRVKKKTKYKMVI